MILLVGNEDDISTDYFMEWSGSLQIPVLRINERDAINIIKVITLSNAALEIVMSIKGRNVHYSEIEAIWFRRGNTGHHSMVQANMSLDDTIFDSIFRYLKNESQTLNDFLIHALLKKAHIGDPSKYNSNKLIALQTAIEVGLLVPETLITQEPGDLNPFFSGQKIITKSIQDALQVGFGGTEFSPTVHELNIADLSPEHQFYYSKFQIRIQKKYELRIFFIGDQFFTGAIFSKNSTTVRNAGSKIVPFVLPDHIRRSLQEFNRILGFDSGSIDMLVDLKDNFYFLEINPVGQYDYLSKHCNFNLDLVIAQHFKSKIEHTC